MSFKWNEAIQQMKMKERAYTMATDIAEDLIGHIAMPGVTSYVVDAINEKYGTEFEDAEDLVEFANDNGAELAECSQCGWYVEYESYLSPDESESGVEEMGCEDCLEYMKKED